MSTTTAQHSPTSSGQPTSSYQTGPFMAEVPDAARYAPSSSAPDQDNQRRFLAKVVPWQPDAYVNIHTLDPAGQFPGMPGRAYRALSQDMFDFINLQAKSKHVFVCMSAQSMALSPKVDKLGRSYISATRDGKHAVALKSLFLDIDCKGKEHDSYADQAEALAALNEFVRTAALPLPTVIVSSGGGLHVHWTLDRALTPGDWKPLARALVAATIKHGLKCDVGVTTDAARVLRVPGTWNHKTIPPKPVTLVYMADHDIAVEVMEKALEPYKVSNGHSHNGHSHTNGHSHNGHTNGHDFNGEIFRDVLPPRPAVKGTGEFGEARDLMPQAELRSCLDVIPNTKLDWNWWNKIGMTIYAATQGEVYGLEEWERWSAKNPHANGKDNCADRWEAYHGSPPTQLTSGSLVHEARQATGNPNWMPPPHRGDASAESGPPPGTAVPPQMRDPLKGGNYNPAAALELINSHYFIGTADQETAIFRIQHDGSPVFVPPEQFKLEVQNIFVQWPESTKRVPAEKFWKEHPYRHQRKIVFKPGGTAEADEFNLWQGYGVAPRRTRRKVRSLLRHIWRVLCRRDKEKFKYVLCWLAWAVQNPDKHPGVVIVLKSRMQGTGKSTLEVVMLRIFGQHGALVEDKDRLLGHFNDWLERVCFIAAEEVLWAGDLKAGDKLKSIITADTIQIERKFGGCRSIPNRLHIIMTTNHDHAVAAGTGDRRFVVLDVSDEHAGDKSYFDRLYLDLDEGGTGEFLDLLLNVDLEGWHPRKLIKTAEATEQQRMSGDSISQWAQACINDDAITGPGPYRLSYDLGARTPTTVLRDAYTGYCKQHGLRAATEEVFGKACTEMFGPRQRCPAAQGSTRRPWGYDVPDGEAWQERLNAYLGIK